MGRPGGAWFRAAAFGLFLTLLLHPAAPRAQGFVELELVLAVDASSSVSAPEFDLQVRGLADAFRAAEVVHAIVETAPGGVAVALIQWSSPGSQVVAVDWTRVADAAAVETLARRIEASGRLILGETAIDGALAFAVEQLQSNGYAGGRRVIDLSGDGQANWGPDPDAVRDRAVAAGITINALAVTNEQPRLGDYYRDHVIGGPGAFVLAADDYADFARAMRAKLVREIGQDVLSLSSAPPFRAAALSPKRE
jgi:hypothetical protein